MILSDRNVFVGAHILQEQKDQLRFQAARRRVSMSALVASIIADWLISAPSEKIEVPRSNKRDISDEMARVEAALAREIDVPLPLEK